MAQYIFQTDGDYVNFNGGGGLWRLARASNCIAWRFDQTGDLFFDVYDQQYVVKAENIAQVVIDGAPLAAASDFPDAITAVFTGLGGGGGASYLVYTAQVSQNGTSAPTPNALSNTMGFGNWTRSSVGLFINTSTTNYDVTKLWMGGVGLGGGLSNPSQPYLVLSDAGAVFGYIFFTLQNSATNVRLYMECFDATFTNVDLSTLLGDDNILSIPEIRSYP